MFDVDKNFVFDLTRSHCPNTALKRNLSMKLLIIKVKRHRTLQTTHLTSILKKYYCRNITATIITKNSDLSFKVKLKEQNKAFIVNVRLEVNCRCNKNERADRKTCVKKNNKLRKKELSDGIIAQVSLEHHKLLSLGPSRELPVIHTENERRFNEKIITKLSNTLGLNCCYLKIICFLHPCYLRKIIGDILKNVQKTTTSVLTHFNPVSHFYTP